MNATRRDLDRRIDSAIEHIDKACEALWPAMGLEQDVAIVQALRECQRRLRLRAERGKKQVEGST